jgi:predicted small metal-binding protein
MLPKYYGKSIDELMEIAEDRARNELTFDRIPEDKRIKVFTVDRCEESINQIKERVEAARKIYEQLFNEV